MPEIVFKGKEYVYNHDLTVPCRPLVVNQAKGIGPADLDSNLVIHGDNLHALKGLLQSVVRDLVFEGDWRGTLNARQFQPAAD